MNQTPRICIVTGGGSGIGRVTALALAQAGHSVVAAGRRQHRIQKTAGMHNGAIGCILPVVTDVRQPASVNELFATTTRNFGRVDVLFNNAGVNTAMIPLEELSLDQWQNVVDINLTGVFVCTKQAFTVMKNQNPMGGRIINNGSVSAYVPRPGAIAYTAAKHAVTGLTRSTSLEGRQYNIACGQIDIGNASTDMSNSTQAQGALQANGTLLVEESFAADHVAQAVVYMVSLPLDTNVQFMTVMATKMPFIGRG